MYQLLALLTGVIISVMVSVNGDLTQNFGAFYAAVIIHIVGVIFAFILCFCKKEKIRWKTNAPLWAYLGGAVGVLTTLFNNYAFGRISVTSIVALGLLGQSVTSTFLDKFGLFGMEKRPIGKAVWVGMLLSCAGVGIMMDSSVSDGLIAVLLSLGAGITIVMSRTVNSRLSKEVGALPGSFYNHLVGLPVCILLALAIPTVQKVNLQSLNPWMFCGGMFGVLVVAMFNVCVPRVPAFRLTLLSFIGQIFSGIAIDLVYGRDISGRMFWGGIVCAVGLLAGMLLEHGGEEQV